MHSIEQLRIALRDRRLDLVARATGLHPNTISAIRDGETTNPSMRTMEVLSAYIDSTSPSAVADKGGE